MAAGSRAARSSRRTDAALRLSTALRSDPGPVAGTFFSAAAVIIPEMASSSRLLVAGLGLVLATTITIAQERADSRALTTADYARAETFMPYNTTPLVLHSGVRPAWVQGDGSDRFWYRTTSEKGSEAALVDPVKATRSACDLPACQASDRDDPA